MALVHGYTPLNMLNGFNVSNLLFADNYYGNSGSFTAVYSNDTFQTAEGN